MSNLYIVRHGNYAQLHKGLNQMGERQARAIGQVLAERLDKKPYVIISSPHRRTRETAEIIAKHVEPVSFEEDPRLTEIKKGESLESVRSRALNVFSIATKLTDNDVIIVTHRAVIQQMLGPVLGTDPKTIEIEKGQLYELSVTGFARARYEDRWGLSTL